MKGLSFFNKIAYFFNLIFALVLLAACGVPYLSLDLFPFLSILSLGVPALVVVNGLFFLYWLLNLKWQALTSLFVLVFGYFTLGTFIKIAPKSIDFQEDELKVMTYNVRAFNRYHFLDNDNIPEEIENLVKQEKPDIISFQEVGHDMQVDYLDYPYHFLKRIPTGGKVHMAIFSKYPIINAELINFPNSINNGSYADILYKKDTIRLYNLHMQSLGITPGTGVLRSQSSDRLYRRVTNAFKRQQHQAQIIAEHKAKSPYKTLVCGDFNNTQFSSVYHTIKGDMQDTFIAKGSGYGRTYNFLKIPIRIDFIMADANFEVMAHKNYDNKYSDHFPVMASFRLKE
ncbi:Metal-dependent hydrolase, endonuclease/exonuclease/phosphatase family [Zobellia uliginosa]|uniref:Metal-dependent hydrolase, endonuclease/exonuclease/phosphatase family n=1 Tax=Zobellia uliginosa TaxID=143224 RepID=A0ABY1KMI1_9FLAO|nr:endonuclease/exonuclease/phosphatase family protein [Zobellia uliginosa]SIS49803.1 Metal-dependent hydrolase, endonuclease/exonuclease/phosphatase family [Zobellia uliginosa]